MGGHALSRGDPAYQQAAELGSALSARRPDGAHRRRPGRDGGREPRRLPRALAGRARTGPGTAGRGADYRGSVDAWAAGGPRGPRRAGRRTAPVGACRIPTWFYGHEPTNVFATAIAKYFANALREDTLLHRCRGGIVFLPGAAGTVQEIFQASTENFYAATSGLVAPLVLVGVEYWTRTLPAWPLLERLGEHRAMAARCTSSTPPSRPRP